MSGTLEASPTPITKHPACDYCPVSELQLAVLLGRSDPRFQPVRTDDAFYGSEFHLTGEAKQRLELLLRIYQRLRQLAPKDSIGLANRWVFQPGLLQPITEDSIVEYLLADPSVARFWEVHDYLQTAFHADA